MSIWFAHTIEKQLIMIKVSSGNAKAHIYEKEK
jgi:hypothetical protein